MKITNKKNKILIFSVLAVFVMSGQVFFSPKLINADKPFIDLSGSVGDSVGNAQSAYAIANPVPSSVASPGESNYDLEIKVSEETIYVDGSLYTLETLKNEIASGKFKGKYIRLLDDYAEVFTFIDVKKALLTDESITFDCETKDF